MQKIILTAYHNPDSLEARKIYAVCMAILYVAVIWHG